MNDDDVHFRCKERVREIIVINLSVPCEREHMPSYPIDHSINHRIFHLSYTRDTTNQNSLNKRLYLTCFKLDESSRMNSLSKEHVNKLSWACLVFDFV